MRIFLCVAVVLLCLLAAGRAVAQAYQLQGGGSSLLGAEGATVTEYNGNVTTMASLGYADGFRLGFSRSIVNGAQTLRLGDGYTALPLPTDANDAPATFRTRGILLAEKTDHGSFAAFAGGMGGYYATGFLQANSIDKPLAFVAWNENVSSRLQVSALGSAGDGVTALASARYAFGPTTYAAASTGSTSSNPAARMTFATKQPSWSLIVQETVGRWRVQPRLQANGELVLERSGLNVRGERHFGTWLLLDAAHDSFASYPASDARQFSRMDEGGTTVRWGQLYTSLRGFRSSDSIGRTDGEAVTTGWANHWAQARLTLMKDSSTVSGKSRSADIWADQRVTQRLHISEDLTLSGGTASFGGGGSLDTRWGSFSLTQHEVYVPFGTAPGFQRALMVSFSVHPFGNWSSSGDFTSGKGFRTSYGLAAGTILEGPNGDAGAGANRAPHFGKYLVRGVVLDEHNRPVRGAAVSVGGQLFYTTSDGSFEARTDHARPVMVGLAAGEFLTTEQFAMNNAATQVLPAQRNGKLVTLHVHHCTACARSMKTEIAENEADNDDHHGGLLQEWRSLFRAAASR